MKNQNIVEDYAVEVGMKKGLSFYWKLFSATFSLSAFTFGGGYIIIPLMRKKFVEQYHWIEEEEMMDLTAIAQSSPGAMAVNASILVGYRLAGIPGFPEYRRCRFRFGRPAH